MNASRLLVISSLIGAALVPLAGFAEEVAPRVPVEMPSTPALSPDGKQIAFSWAGDLWTSRARGGNAKRITTHPA